MDVQVIDVGLPSADQARDGGIGLAQKNVAPSLFAQVRFHGLPALSLLDANLRRLQGVVVGLYLPALQFPKLFGEIGVQSVRANERRDDALERVLPRRAVSNLP